MTAEVRELVQRALIKAKANSAKELQMSAVFDSAALTGIESLAAVGQRDIERLAIYGASKGLYAVIRSKAGQPRQDRSRPDRSRDEPAPHKCPVF